MGSIAARVVQCEYGSLRNDIWVCFIVLERLFKPWEVRLLKLVFCNAKEVLFNLGVGEKLHSIWMPKPVRN